MSDSGHASVTRFPLPTRRHTRRLGQEIAAQLKPGTLLLLSGELGAGKTFLARAIARALGVPSRIAIASPTFTLVQEYETAAGPLLHVDLYRLREEEDLQKTRRDVRRLGLEERRAEGAILMVEWGQALEDELGGPASLRVDLRIEPEGRVATLCRGEGIQGATSLSLR